MFWLYIDWLIIWLIDWLIGWLIDWLIVWLTDWLTVVLTLLERKLAVTGLQFKFDYIYLYTAILRKIVNKSARDNPERYCGWFWVHCSSKKFERMAREAMDICLRVVKESNKSGFEYSVRNSVFLISHITFRDCRVHIFSDNLSRNSCISGEKPALYNCTCYYVISEPWRKNV